MNTDQLLRKAMTLLNRQKTGPAKAICRKVLKQTPDNFNAQHLYGVLALKEQEYALADQALMVATQMQASDKYLAQTWNNLALTRIYDQRLGDAWEAATEALNWMPINPLSGSTAQLSVKPVASGRRPNMTAVKHLRWIQRTRKPLHVWLSPCAIKSRLKLRRRWLHKTGICC